ncbi:hypothetical protein HYU95_03845 [Candidatus Daviesbacteria bacterium]|nr:hypothetical protein [Candidatus Daviesbacteria bacterium]
MFELEPRQFIYNRTGNLAQTTTLDQELAGLFMRISDLRRDVVIVDSDKKPEKSAVAVGADVLAWRSIAPLSELTKIALRPGKFHQIEIVDGRYRVLVHDRIIDDDIKKRGYQNREDYEGQYLTRLQKEIKSAACEILFREKLGLHDQRINWLVYSMYIPNIFSDLLRGDYEAAAITLGISILAGNSILNVWRSIEIDRRIMQGDRLPLYLTPRPWQEILYPVLPVDKWIKGRLLLARYGEELIIPRI